MTDFISRHSLFLTSVILVIGSFQLMNLSFENKELSQSGAKAIVSIVSPVEKLHHEGIESISNIWNHYVWLMDVEKESESLQKRIKTLEAQNSKLLEYERENLRLRQLLDYQEARDSQGVVASVIGRDPSNWYKTVDIDQGAINKLRPGFAVVDGRAIVGQVTVVAERASKVLLLTDSTSAVDAIIQRNRAPGIVEGTNGKSLLMQYVLKSEDVRIGDRVVASGLDGVYPKGTLIGVVTSVDSDQVGLFQQVTVQPNVDYRRLETVYVITDIPLEYGINSLEHTTEDLQSGTS